MSILQVFFTQEDLRNTPSLPDVPMADIQISDNDIYDKLCHLDANKSPGPDGWHPRFFKEAALELSKPLACSIVSEILGHRYSF